MTFPPYKVAFFKKDDANNHFSSYFVTENEAKEYAQRLMNLGNEVLVFKEKNKDFTSEPPYQEWEILSYGNRRKFKTIMFLASPSFLVPLGIGIFAFLLLRKNNGLPKIIA